MKLFIGLNPRYKTIAMCIYDIYMDVSQRRLRNYEIQENYITLYTQLNQMKKRNSLIRLYEG